ncbi:MAG: hypothetical protein FJ405_17095 [Verrucomicrobia bacterium]|nr:hypothetical protein [Verrucomicrobiota bacterium]
MKSIRSSRRAATAKRSTPFKKPSTSIFLNANTGATIAFGGPIGLNTSANTPFTATGGGTVTATGIGLYNGRAEANTAANTMVPFRGHWQL